MATAANGVLTPIERGAAPAPRWLSDSRVLALLDFAAGAAAVVVLVSLAIVVVGHITDRYHLNFATGVSAALAERLNGGVLYPALYDGAHYGGTRYMPLSFAIHAGLAHFTGEYILSGKLVAFFLSTILCIQLYCIVREFGCGRGVSLALASLGVVTQSGYLVATSIRADLMAVVLQLGALQVARGGDSAARATGAGVLCTLALLAKFTAAWAPAAILIVYFVKHRRASVIFLASWLCTLAVALICLHIGTSGRMLDSFRAAAVQNVGVVSILKSPIAFLARLGRGGAAEAFLIPLAILECVLALRQRRFTIYHGALLLLLPILLVIFTDLGADFNHLLDLVVLAIPLAGSLWASLPSTDRAHVAVRSGLAVAVCWVLFMCWTATLGNPLRVVVTTWIKHGKTGFPAKPLAGLVPDDATLLCEDPWIPVSRNQAPTIIDPYAVACMTRTHPKLYADLVKRIEDGGFDQIVLRLHGGDFDPSEEGEWEDRTIGRPAINAVRSHYVVQKQAEGYLIYAPRKRDEGTEMRRAAN
jgi:hypothetical protein